MAGPVVPEIAAQVSGSRRGSGTSSFRREPEASGDKKKGCFTGSPFHSVKKHLLLYFKHFACGCTQQKKYDQYFSHQTHQEKHFHLIKSAFPFL